MPSDRSRLSDRPRRLYSGIVAQQGRVLLDRDVNDLQDIVLSRLATDVRGGVALGCNAKASGRRAIGAGRPGAEPSPARGRFPV